MRLETVLQKGATREAINQLKRNLGFELLAEYCAYYRTLKNLSKRDLRELQGEIKEKIDSVTFGDCSPWSAEVEDTLRYFFGIHFLRFWKHRKWLYDSHFKQTTTGSSKGIDNAWAFLAPLAQIFYCDIGLPSENACGPRSPDDWLMRLGDEKALERGISSRGRKLGYSAKQVGEQLANVCATGNVDQIVTDAQQYIANNGYANLPMGLDFKYYWRIETITSDFEKNVEELKKNIAEEKGKWFFRDEQHQKDLSKRLEVLVRGFPAYYADLDGALVGLDHHQNVWEKLKKNLERRNQAEQIAEVVTALMRGIPEEFFLAKKEKDLLG
jgi:hypothetical protein